MRYCEYCGKAMHTSLCGMWVGGTFREVHKKCKKGFIDVEIAKLKSILINLEETKDILNGEEEK